MDGRKLTGVEMGAVLLVLIGGVNWLLVGLFDYNLVTSILGDGSSLSRIVFIVVGLATLYVLSFGPKLLRQK